MYELIETRWGNDYRVTIDTIGLDYESAVDAMPHWYGVSFGNGNDGVSHIFANFYVRTCEPFTLAAAAVLSDFSGKDLEWAAENLELEGEAGFGISATLLNPPDDREDHEFELAAAQAEIDAAESDDDREEAESKLAELEDNDPGSWSDVNGAWRICEVFRVEWDDMNGRAPEYDSLAECFDSAELLELARAI